MSHISQQIKEAIEAAKNLEYWEKGAIDLPSALNRLLAELDAKDRAIEAMRGVPVLFAANPEIAQIVMSKSAQIAQNYWLEKRNAILTQLDEDLKKIDV